MTLRRIVASGLALAMAVLLSTVPAAAAKPAPSGKVNLNTASLEQLTALPGVGPKLAARIVEHREKAGRFKSIQELMTVRGIGEKNFQRLERYLSVGETPRAGGN